MRANLDLFEKLRSLFQRLTFPEFLHGECSLGPPEAARRIFGSFASGFDGEVPVAKEDCWGWFGREMAYFNEAALIYYL